MEVTFEVPTLPDAANIGAKVNDAMCHIGTRNPPCNIDAVQKERSKDMVEPGRCCHGQLRLRHQCLPTAPQETTHLKDLTYAPPRQSVDHELSVL